MRDMIMGNKEMALLSDKVDSASGQIGIPAESTPLESRSVLRIKKATDALTDVGALTDIGRKASRARGIKEPLARRRKRSSRMRNYEYSRKCRRNYSYSRRTSYYSYKE